MHRLPRWLALAAATSMLACSVDVNIEGKRCPCSDGYVCDALSDRCVASTCTPAVTVTDLAGIWVTANAIRWTWEPQGMGDQLLGYELVVARTREDIAARSGSAHVYDAETNPELGAFTLPFVGGVVNATTTSGLDAGTNYLAQLTAIDTNLCTFGSAVAAKATWPEPPSTLVIYRDSLPSGATLVPGAPSLTEVADATGNHIEYSAGLDSECHPEVPNVEDVRAICGQPLRLQSLQQELSYDPTQPNLSRLQDNSIGSAFLEMRVSYTSPIASFFGMTWLRFEDCFSDASVFRFDAWTLPAGEDDMILQFPLEALSNGSRALEFADIDTTAAGTPLCGFALGGQWHKTSVVRIDDVVIRY